MNEIIKYNEQQHYDLWDDFVNHSVNGTIFHMRRFINYHHKDKFEDFSLLFFEKDKLLAVFPAAIINKNGQRVLKSHPGTSYGGPVFKKPPQLRKVFAFILSLEQFSKNYGIDLIEFRESPKIFFKQPMDQLDFALIHNNYRREDEELSTCYPLADYKDLSVDEMLDKFDKSGRNKIRKNVLKAIKSGLELRIIPDRDIDLYYNILLHNLKKHNTTPAHKYEEVVRLRELFSDRITLYGVYKNSELTAGFVIFNINKQGNHVFYASLDYRYQDLRPTTFGLFMLLRQFANEGYPYLNMGISTEDGGKIINWNLFNFKESFNGTGILRTYWQKFLK